MIFKVPSNPNYSMILKKIYLHTENTVKFTEKCNLLLKPASINAGYFVSFPTKRFLESALLYSAQTYICIVVGIKTPLKKKNPPSNQTTY